MEDQNTNLPSTQNKPIAGLSGQSQQPEPEAETQTKPNSKIADIKQRALQELVPVIDSLEGDPERKYEILMTAARAASSGELLDKALDNALRIEDKTAKAEAIVDVLNEASFQEQSS